MTGSTFWSPSNVRHQLHQRERAICAAVSTVFTTSTQVFRPAGPRGKKKKKSRLLRSARSRLATALVFCLTSRPPRWEAKADLARTVTRAEQKIRLKLNMRAEKRPREEILSAFLLQDLCSQNQKVHRERKKYFPSSSATELSHCGSLNVALRRRNRPFKLSVFTESSFNSTLK